MSLKTVFIHQYGRKLREFTCELVDITKNQVVFFDCIGSKKQNKAITLRHYGNMSSFTSWPDRETILTLHDEPGIEIFIRW